MFLMYIYSIQCSGFERADMAYYKQKTPLALRKNQSKCKNSAFGFQILEQFNNMLKDAMEIL